MTTDFHDFIWSSIRDSGRTQTELAEAAGLSRQTFLNVINRKRQTIPEVDQLDAVARALGAPKRTLRILAAQAWGYTVEGLADDESEGLIAKYGELSEERRRDLHQFADLWLAEERKAQAKPGGRKNRSAP